jgi:uroporphyrinogen decarboxylase
MVLTREAEKKLMASNGGRPSVEFLDNDVIQVNAPWWSWHQLGDDWRLPDAPTSPARVTGSGDYQGFFDRLRLLRAHSDKYILVMFFGSHFEKANSARGIENFLMDMAGAPEFAKSLLNRIIDKNMVMLENILAAPEIDGVLLGSDWGSQRGLLMSPEVWHEMIEPGERREYDLIHSYSKDVWVHSCGSIEPIIPSLIEMGVNVLNPVQPEAMDIARLKADYGKRITFWGAVSTQDLLPNGTPEQVRTEARKIRAMMSEGGGYVFGPSQDIQDDVPVANIQALLEVAREPL